MVIISIYILLVLIPHAASITFNFTNISPQNLNRDIVTAGDAYISSNGIHVALHGICPNCSQGLGRATYIRSLHLWDKTSSELASFSTKFALVIDPSSTFTDGMTFFLAENNSVLRGYGAMGLPIDAMTNNVTNQFVAVEFDTLSGNWDPISDFHVGIDVNSLASSRIQKWNISGVNEYQASVNYDSLSKNLSVSVTDFEYGVIELSYIIDLKAVLPEWVIFGFSSAAGDVYARNSVKSWAFNSSDLQVDEDKGPPATTSPKNNTQNSMLPPTAGQNSVKGKNKSRLTVGLIAGLSVIPALLVIFAIFLWRKKNKGDEAEELGYDQEEMNNDFEVGTGPKRFSYKQLVQATSGFAVINKLGEGGFGGVYKGFLKDQGTYIAVKRVSKISEQGIMEYASEVKIISRLRHKNLVELKGWCHEKSELLLIYEFMEYGSLDLHLFKEKSLLTWEKRYPIAHGLASALVYLHEECTECILHRDIKSSNVMLDSNFNAKLGDFGLAKLVDHEKGSQTSILAGTLGYMAPEYVMTGKASKESDVFSFGVVALEIACGRKSIMYKTQESQTNLVEWVWELYGAGTVVEAADPCLGSDFGEEEIERLMIIGLWCAHPHSHLRPSMRQVIQVLKFEASLPQLPSKMPMGTLFVPPTSTKPGTTSITTSSSDGSKMLSLKLETSSTSSSSSPYV